MEVVRLQRTKSQRLKIRDPIYQLLVHSLPTAQILRQGLLFLDDREEILLKNGMNLWRLQRLRYPHWRGFHGGQEQWQELQRTKKLQRTLKHICNYLNLVYPCPKGSLRHREMVRKMGGKEQFPFIVDPNGGISMYESGEIVKYLYQQYGQGRKPSSGLLGSTLFTGWMPTILRAGRGMTLWGRAKSELPPKKLELFSYENNPYARIVREALCELELPYILRNVGEGSSNSDLLLQTSGSREVPYLVDPNTGIQLGNYKMILSYLFRTYSDAN